LRKSRLPISVVRLDGRRDAEKTVDSFFLVGRPFGESINEAARIVQLAFSVGMMKSWPTDEASMMTIGWLVILFGVIAVQWADGRFPFAA
jgi:hypothetical protein